MRLLNDKTLSHYLFELLDSDEKKYVQSILENCHESQSRLAELKVKFNKLSVLAGSQSAKSNIGRIFYLTAAIILMGLFVLSHKTPPNPFQANTASPKINTQAPERARLMNLHPQNDLNFGITPLSQTQYKLTSRLAEIDHFLTTVDVQTSLTLAYEPTIKTSDLPFQNYCNLKLNQNMSQ